MDGVVLDIDHLHETNAGGVGQMVNGKQEAEDIDNFDQRLCVKIAGSGFLFKLFKDFRAAGNGFFRSFFNISQWKYLPL